MSVRLPSYVLRFGNDPMTARFRLHVYRKDLAKYHKRSLLLLFFSSKQPDLLALHIYHHHHGEAWLFSCVGTSCAIFPC